MHQTGNARAKQQCSCEKYNSKSWWDVNVVRLLCELVIISQDSSGMSTNQTAATIIEKAVAEKNKYAQDKANREDAIKIKRDLDKAENEANKAQRVEALAIEHEKVAVLRALAASIQAPAAGVPQQQQQLDPTVDARLTALENNVNRGFMEIMNRLSEERNNN
jgi:hypothetical protein